MENKIDFNLFDEAGKKYKEELDKNPDALGGNFDVLPDGKYEVKAKKFELKQVDTQKGAMLVADFKFEVINGDNKGRQVNPSIFVFGNKTKEGSTVDKNGTSLDLRKIHECLEFLRSLKPSFADEIKWTGSYADMNSDILDVIDEITANKCEYQIEIKSSEYQGKMYPNYKIIQKF